MNDRLIQLLQRLTPEEEAEVETLAAAIVARRDSENPQLQSDDISPEELAQLVVDSGGFDWLRRQKRTSTPWRMAGRYSGTFHCNSGAA